MYRKVQFLFAMLAAATCSMAQTTYLPVSTEDYQLLDRLETRSGHFSDSLSLSDRPESRMKATEFLLQQREAARYIGLSGIDRYNVNQAISENGEWAPGEDGAIDSKHPWFKTFYKKQYDFVHVKTHDFFMVVNPIITLEAGGESATGGSNKIFWSSRGAEVRGWISKKIGFYTQFTDNQEYVPSYVSDYEKARQAVPGADYYTRIGGKAGQFDYLLATGYIDFAIVKDHLNMTAGYGKNFWGDGVRSLFLSDFSASYPYLRIDTRIWKLNYQNLFMELTPQYTRGLDKVLPHKYATMHDLSINATPWLNVGIFEAVIFDRPGGFELSYANPIIFLRSTERSNGSPDNELLGFHFKAIAVNHLQFYGQFLLDEFTSKQFFSHNGYWANKFGVQLGGKYFDAFTVKNLDLQAELNVVRPYTYSHSDTLANYTHYNQPLAHPLGSGFVEFLAMARYQPIKDVYVSLKTMYYTKGANRDTLNYGNNIFNDYDSRPSNYGVSLINGVSTKCALVNFNISYQARRNLFIDFGATHRKYAIDGNGPVYSSTGTVTGDNSSTVVYFGVRLNAPRRDYDFY